MASSLFNKFSNMSAQNQSSNNLLQQIQQVKNDPGSILDILSQAGKITSQQYDVLQPYKNNPQFICEYLMKNGNMAEISNLINQLRNYR